MPVIPFPAASEPEPEPAAVPPPLDLFAPLDAMVHNLIEICGDKTVGEALEDLMKMPAKDVLKGLL